jgi:predicted phosphodiesterase
MRRIAVFSDVHGNYQVLKSIIDDLSQNRFDDVICLGDLVGIGPESFLCLEEIKNSNIKMVLGNHELYQLHGTEIDNLPESFCEHERWVNNTLSLEQLAFLKTCPLHIDILEDGKLFTFSHFLFDRNNDKYPFLPLSVINDDIKTYLKEISCDYLFFGHEHNSFSLDNVRQVFTCVGSSGCVFSNVTFYTVIEIYDDLVKVYKRYISYDRKAFEKSLKNIEYPDREFIAKSFFNVDL